MDLSIPRGEEERPAEEVFKEAPEDARVRGHVAFRSVPPCGLTRPDIAGTASALRVTRRITGLRGSRKKSVRLPSFPALPAFSCFPSVRWSPSFGGPASLRCFSRGWLSSVTVVNRPNTCQWPQEIPLPRYQHPGRTSRSRSTLTGPSPSLVMCLVGVTSP